MAVDFEIGVAGAVGRVEQGSLCRQRDQDVSLLRLAPARIAIVPRQSLVEYGHSTTRCLQLRTQRLERARSFCLRSASCSSTSGAKGAPGSLFVRSTRASSGS